MNLSHYLPSTCEGQKEKLKAVPDWQERLREFVDQLISDIPKND
ncbi:MAG: hypothetical protein RM021_028190 [Nostoc sp. EkiNYC01]|nr:hypothetical protein [Nostoc sp. EkiNYC01]